MRYVVKRNDSKYLHIFATDGAPVEWVADMHNATLCKDEDEAHAWCFFKEITRNEYEVIAVQLIVCAPIPADLANRVYQGESLNEISD